MGTYIWRNGGGEYHLGQSEGNTSLLFGSGSSADKETTESETLVRCPPLYMPLGRIFVFRLLKFWAVASSKKLYVKFWVP